MNPGYSLLALLLVSCAGMTAGEVLQPDELSLGCSVGRADLELEPVGCLPRRDFDGEERSVSAALTWYLAGANSAALELRELRRSLAILTAQHPAPCAPVDILRLGPPETNSEESPSSIQEESIPAQDGPAGRCSSTADGRGALALDDHPAKPACDLLEVAYWLAGLGGLVLGYVKRHKIPLVRHIRRPRRRST